MKKERNQEKTKKISAADIIKILMGIIGIAIIILVLFREKIFKAGSYLATLYNADRAQTMDVRFLKAIIVVIACITVYNLMKLIILRMTKNSNKMKTASDLLLSLLKYIAGILIILMVLSAFGVDTSTLVAGAGVLSLIVGLGCQSLISDIVAGLFIIFEGDFVVGDIVVIGGWRGTVESIGIRTTKIIDASGNVKIINNSNISDIVNNTKELSVAVCTCGIEYGDSIERVENIINQNLDFMKSRIPTIIKGPFYKGVEELGDSAVVIKLVANCKEEDKYQVQRDMNRELKIIFDKNGVGIPFPQIVINQPASFDDVTTHERKEANQFVDEQKESSKGVEEVNQ